MNIYTQTIDDFDLSVDTNRIVPIGPFTRVTVQATNPDGVTWTTAVITMKRSLTGVHGDAVALATPTTITAVGITEMPDGDAEGSAFLHLHVTTAESASGEITLTIYATDIGA